MPADPIDPLVSTEWLADHLSAPDVRIVDASWYLPHMGRNARAEYLAGHIPGAVFLDIDEISDRTTTLPHMLPPPEMFSSRMRKLGLGDGLRIVVYDGFGIFSAPRVWWMCRAFGHHEVMVLDGGLPKWRAEGRPLSDDPAPIRDRHRSARLDHTRLRSLDQVLASLTTNKDLIVDARSAARFDAREDEPRPGLRRGHVPGAINLPWTEVLRADGTMKDAADLHDLFRARGILVNRPITLMCGSGVSACIVNLALERIGQRHVAIYDGSWAEWGARDDLPVAP